MADLSETGRGRLAYSVLNWVDEAHKLFEGLQEDYPNSDFSSKPDIDAFYERFLALMGKHHITKAMAEYAAAERALEDFCANLMISQLK